MIKLNESANCPSLNWEKKVRSRYPGDFGLIAMSEPLNGEKFLFKVYSSADKSEYQSTCIKILYNGDENKRIKFEIEGTVEDGKAICQELWKAVCAVSEYLKVDWYVLDSIAKFQGYVG